jgi:hypothetical protein
MEMNRAEHDMTKIASPRAGFFAMLGDLLSRSGCGPLSLAPLRLCGRPALVVSLALAVAGILWVDSSSAVAAQQPHAFLSAFGSVGTGAGQFELGNEAGAAVDQSTGDVYVADSGNHRVDEFTAAGAFIHAFGWGVKTGDTSDTGLDACTTASGCQAGFPGPEPGQFEQPTWLAVDNTPSGGGDVYVADDGSVANARQTITVNATGGSYTLSYASFMHATTAKGSPLVTAVTGPWGVGEPVSGTGIPPGATIAHSVSPNSFELSANAMAGGRATLSVTRDITAPIAYNAPAKGEGSVEAALGAEIGEGNVSVSGGSPGHYTVEFVNVLADTSIPQMIADSSGLSGGTATTTLAIEVEGRNTARVQKFDPAGNLVTGWGGTPAPGELDGTSCIEVCGSNPHFGELYGVAVKPDGKLLVLTRDNIFSSPSTDLFEATQSSGEFIEAPGTYGTGAPIGIALDSAGHLYLGNPKPSFVEVLQASPCWHETIYTACEKQPVFSRPPNAYQPNFTADLGPATGVAVESLSEDVYVARYNRGSHHSEVSVHNSEDLEVEPPFGGGEIKATKEKEITQPAGIAVSSFSGSTSDVYAADPGAGRVEIFAPGGERDALAVTRVGSGLGSVTSQPAGVACPFTCSGSFAEHEEVTLTATAPEHSSFIGWSGGGCSGAGVCQIALSAATSVTATFAYDRPVLMIAAVSAITLHTATLNGEVNPEGDAFSCRFEYGATIAYGAEVPCSAQPGSSAASAELWDLAASTTYHYRLVAVNSGGATYGPDQTFTTASEDCAGNAALCSALPVAPSLVTVAIVLPKQPAPTTRALTNVQKLAKALGACRKQKKRSVRVNCERRAKRRYGPTKKKVKKSKRNRERG